MEWKLLEQRVDRAQAVHFYSAQSKEKTNKQKNVSSKQSLIINWMYSILVLCLNKLYIGYSLGLGR